MSDAKIVFGPGCSTRTIWAVKHEIYDDMYDFYHHQIQQNDKDNIFQRILNQDFAKQQKFEESARYKKWIGHKSADEIYFMKFDTLYRYYCEDSQPSDFVYKPPTLPSHKEILELFCHDKFLKTKFLQNYKEYNPFHNMEV